MNYYNEIDKSAVAWLRVLISERLIPEGHIDERSITEVQPADLDGYDQCHFFAGIGGWPLALQLAGWPESEQVWTGSCPCQPLSCAGQRQGHADERHLWPAFYRLIAKCRPATVFGEQVAGNHGIEWMSGVRADLEGIRYACGIASLCAAGVGAPHVRQRLFWIANSSMYGCKRLQRCPSAQIQKNRTSETLDAWHGSGSPFEHWQKLLAEPHVMRMDDGVSSMLDIRPRLHAYGNAIVPQVAAHFIAASREVIT